MHHFQVSVNGDKRGERKDSKRLDCRVCHIGDQSHVEELYHEYTGDIY